MWRRHMKTSSLHSGPADGTPYTTSHNPLRHRDPATYHTTWLSSTSTNPVRERMLKRARPRQSRHPNQKRGVKSRRASRRSVVISGPKLLLFFQTSNL
ncbi:hypothetical protein J4Q44_G00365150 [Coregonus suidteri]|uniref:Uncharacterized protein n=1 Tax=Coregonus suidteri TaxID=861788 RepID=A0AAN8Q674_9TELE